MKSIPIFTFFSCLLFTFATLSSAFRPSEENQIPNVVKKMQAAFEGVEDYTCEAELIFYQEGIEYQRYQFKYYFKKKKRIRVDFHSPYPTLSLFYTGRGEEVTAVPLRQVGLLKFRLSLDNPRIQTMAGQKINQTDMGYFIEFLFENLQKVPQGEDEFEEDKDQVRFWFRALDYVRGKEIEKYRIFISKENWLPVRIERYTLEEKPLELSIIKNYTINSHLEDKVFIP